MLRSETQLPEIRPNCAERNRNAVVCFWLYLVSPVRVLGLMRHVPLVPCSSCILNVWVFAPRIFTRLRIPLPSTVTLCELCCPWGILAIDAKNPFPERSNSTYSLLWSVFLACGSLLLSEAFALHVSGQCSDHRELSAQYLCSCSHVFWSSLPDAVYFEAAGTAPAMYLLLDELLWALGRLSEDNACIWTNSKLGSREGRVEGHWHWKRQKGANVIKGHNHVH